MDPQLKAIETINGNVAVNAGAGTGKTKVLTERFVYILENGDLEKFKEVESIVAITFTNKATEEMIERIRGEIKKNFNKGDKWKRFYRDLEKANISTIHGFCGKILRENPVEAIIDPYFEILDENISNDLLNQSIIDVLEEELETEENVFKMMREFKRNRMENILKDIRSVYNNIRTVGMSFIEVKKKTIEYIDSLEYREENIEEIKEILLYLMDNMNKNSKIYKLKSDPIWIKFYNNQYEKENIYSYIEYIQDNLGSSIKELEKQNRLKELLSKVLLGKEKENLWLYKIILDLLIQIDNIYNKYKKEKAGLDYNDLQNKVLDLLDNDNIKKKYQKKFKYFMIDEFQDTNELQKKIFYKLASNKKDLDRENLFIVGDPKQSIYGFRGADIGVFYNTIKDISSYNPENVITLSRNYRSVDTLLEFVNSIFSNLMEDKYHNLEPYHKSKNKIDVEIIEEDTKEIEGIDPATLDNLQESDMIAKRIKDLVEKRRYNYGDFALLFRATTRNHIYEDALKKYGIPYYNFSNKGFFYKEEVIDLINSIKAISNPYDTIGTIGFLRGPMINLRDDTIYWILRNKEENIYQTMVKVKDKEIISKNEKEKLIKAIEILEDFFYIKNLYPISYIIEKLIDKTLFVETLLLQSNGEQALANIYKLLEIVRDYERENKSSLEDLIDYLETSRETDQKEGLIFSEKDNVVNLMTIHGSKGLQFPVVIIPEMARDAGGFYPKILFNKDIGIGIKTENNRSLYDILSKENYVKDIEERNRILYVAMTRAKELLILGNQGKNKGFKKLIKDLLPEGKYSRVNSLSIEKEFTPEVKIVEREAEDNNQRQINIPLLYEIDKYNKRIFNKYTISQYMEFRECKRKFFLNNYWNLNINLEKEEISVPKLTGIDKGNIIHEFCYLYRNFMDKEKLLKDITGKYKINYENIKGDLSTYISNYLNHYNEDYDVIYREKEFYTQIGNGYLNGVIDRVNMKEDEIEIIDYKTNKLINKKELIEKYTPQIQIYAYVLEKILKKKVTKGSILFLETGEEITINISPENLENTKKKLEDFINYINNNSSINNYERSSQCNRYCIYKEFCEMI